MARIPDTIAVASLDTHALIVTVPNSGPADVASSLPRPVAASVLRQLADQLEAQPCPTAAVTGMPCPIHDAPTATAPAAVPDRPALDLLTEIYEELGHGHSAPGLAAALLDRHARDLADRIDTLGKARGWSVWAADYVHPDREFVDSGEQAAADPRPRIEVDLEQPAEPEPIEERPAVPTVVDCAHGYGLMRDSCPGCDAEQETPHEADPVTIRPAWAKRNMRRCRRCGYVPSHPIHRAAQ